MGNFKKVINFDEDDDDIFGENSRVASLDLENEKKKKFFGCC